MTMNLFLACSSKPDSLLQDQFCDEELSLPSDFLGALKYIDDSLDNSLDAYYQLIIKNPNSFSFDFNTIDEAPHYTVSPDKKIRLYNFCSYIYDDYYVLQFRNSKDKVVTAHITDEPLYLMAQGKSPDSKDYASDDNPENVSFLGQVEIDGKTTYIMYIGLDADNDIPTDENVNSFVTGMQLTETGYKYVQIFDDDLGVIGSSSDDSYENYDLKFRFIGETYGFGDLRHGNAWYDVENMKLYLPSSVKNFDEIFHVYKWNNTSQKFVIERYNVGSPSGVHSSLGTTDGLEVELLLSDNLLVRVDRISDESFSYQYASWGQGKTMADEPDMLLRNGVFNKQDGTIHFFNKNYEYIVPCADNKYDSKVVVRCDGKVVNVWE